MSPGVAELLLQRLEQEAPGPGPGGGLCSLEAAAELGLDHQTLVGAVKSLQALGEVIEAEPRAATRWELSAEGEAVARDGSHEVRVFESLPAEGLPQSELMELPGAKVGFSKAMANKWVRLDKEAPGGPRVFRAVSHRGALGGGGRRSPRVPVPVPGLSLSPRVPVPGLSPSWG
ncbi:phenylalanine--tRNA ligase alpha subunit [Apteryx rowi]|uniref:phenylalanine--tRNA ligase alpha subunit n=1 Tax=Apteryx rowi TaxID=308060 RepID=UPI000E1C8230|nr:phenylalanine--tRNA ligase alpha subunit [Apteryx rowi]